DMVDAAGGDVRQVGPAQTEQVMGACFQCKLCEVQCPYTPRDKHEFQLDFPRLVHRYKAQKAREKGVSLRDRILGNPDRTASMARASLGMANSMNRVALHRKFMQATLGIHQDKLLPDFASQTFESWARAEGKFKPPGSSEAVLFPTCYVQNN